MHGADAELSHTKRNVQMPLRRCRSPAPTPLTDVTGASKALTSYIEGKTLSVGEVYNAAAETALSRSVRSEKKVH